MFQNFELSYGRYISRGIEFIPCSRMNRDMHKCLGWKYNNIQYYAENMRDYSSCNTTFVPSVAVQQTLMIQKRPNDQCTDIINAIKAALRMENRSRNPTVDLNFFNIY